MKYYVEMQVLPYTEELGKALIKEARANRYGNELPVLVTTMLVDIDDKEKDLVTSIVPRRVLDSGSRETLRRFRKCLQNLLRVADRMETVPNETEVVIYGDNSN